MNNDKKNVSDLFSWPCTYKILRQLEVQEEQGKPPRGLGRSNRQPQYITVDKHSDTLCSGSTSCRCCSRRPLASWCDLKVPRKTVKPISALAGFASFLNGFVVVFVLHPPKGGWGCLMAPPLSGISGLSFDSTLLSFLLFFCLVLLLFLSYLFLPAGPFF